VPAILRRRFQFPTSIAIDLILRGLIRASFAADVAAAELTDIFSISGIQRMYLEVDFSPRRSSERLAAAARRPAIRPGGGLLPS